MSTFRRTIRLASRSTHAGRTPVASLLGLVGLVAIAGCGGASSHANAPTYAPEPRPVTATAPRDASPPAPYVTTYGGSGAGEAKAESAGAYAPPPAPIVTGGPATATATGSAPTPIVTKSPPPPTTPSPAPVAKPTIAGGGADAPASAPRAVPVADAAKKGAAREESAAPKATTKAAPSPAAPVAPGTTITATGTVVIGGNPPPPPVPTPVVTQTVPQGGVLTASVLDDNAQRSDFNAFLGRYPSFRETWGIELGRRITIRVEDSNGVAVGDAPVALRGPDGSAWQLRAHADGTTWFYPPSGAGVVIANQNANQQQGTTWAIASQVGALRTESTFTMPAVDGTVTVRLPGVPGRAAAPALDVALVVDCTGSMGDEITYLQAELAGVVTAVKSQQGTRRIRLGLVLYRDRGDDFVTKTYDFTEDLSTFLAELKTANAQGGGDIPESVNAALNETVHRLSWAGDETARLAILVADAPPHYYADETWTYKNALPELNARGIKLVTVGASGVDKSTEYLFRQASAYTGGRYVWLTDDSGVGEAHTYADTPSYQVEHLDRLLIRVIGDEARAFRR
jgi:Mg-chelatase subunit ChlD